MLSRRFLWFKFALVLCLVPASSIPSPGQSAPAHRGRKYKAIPPTSHIEVQILKKYNGKPIPNAAVVFNPSMDGKDLGNLEVKTDPEGKAIIDVIPTGSKVSVQVIATGFATFAQVYLVDQPSKEISISMLRPQAQISSYEDNEGKAAARKPGVQEPIRPKSAGPAPRPPTPPAATTRPTPAAPPAQNSIPPESTPNR